MASPSQPGGTNRNAHRPHAEGSGHMEFSATATLAARKPGGHHASSQLGRVAWHRQRWCSLPRRSSAIVPGPVCYRSNARRKTRTRFHAVGLAVCLPPRHRGGIVTSQAYDADGGTSRPIRRAFPRPCSRPTLNSLGVLTSNTQTGVWRRSGYSSASSLRKKLGRMQHR